MVWECEGGEFGLSVEELVEEGGEPGVGDQGLCGVVDGG